MRIAEYTTLRLGGVARASWTVTDEVALAAKVTELDARGEPWFVLGGGSNLVVADEPYLGTVLRLSADAGLGDIQWLEDGRVEVGAACDWDALVATWVMRGLAGAECLSGIPGLVGATPMQNVGAYGQEVSQIIEAVRVFDRQLGEFAWWPTEACRFAYRSSAFRGSARWIVTRVRFALCPSQDSMPVRYSELARALDLDVGGSAPLTRVRETVLRLRRGKGMVVDPLDPESRSAGSFFTNPVLDAPALLRLRARAESLGFGAPPEFAIDGEAGSSERAKVAAAWLIERAGFSKGYGRDGVRISRRHALALVNDGGTTRALVALAREIRDGVHDTFGVTLEAEPIFVGATL